MRSCLGFPRASVPACAAANVRRGVAVDRLRWRPDESVRRAGRTRSKRVVNRRSADGRFRRPAIVAGRQLVESRHLECAGRSAVERVYRLHRPDAHLAPGLRPPPYGIPYIGVGAGQPRACQLLSPRHGSESDSGFGGDAERSRPRRPTPPNYVEGGVPGGGSSGDRHLLVVDRDRWLLFELFAALELERTALGSWIGRGVQPRVERAPSGLDVRRRRAASRFSRVSFATTKPCAARSATHFVSPCARPTATSGPRRIVPGRPGRVADGARLRLKTSRIFRRTPRISGTSFEECRRTASSWPTTAATCM